MRFATFSGNTDAVFLFNVVHGFEAEENASLIARCVDALRPGGRLFILDQFAGSHGGSALARLIPLMVGVNLLSETGGRCYAVREVFGWLAGLRRVRLVKLRVPGVGLITASR
jgi:hypothetical protein